MTSADTQAQKAQVTRALEERYFPIIPQLQRTWTPEQHQKNRLSRSLAAFAIEKLADVTPTQAANSIVDGENDNGIDAIYFDRLQKRLWLVQTKAGKAPDMGENKKFCDGIRDLIHERFGKFNDSFSRLQPDVEAALDAYNAQIIGCHVYLDGELGTHAIADMTQLEEELNQFSLRFNWQDCNLATVHSWLTAEQVITPPSVTLTLEKWFGVDQPRSAFYGLVTAEQLALLYQEHGKGRW